MSETLRIGVLGLSHDHAWGNLEDLKQTEGVQLAAAADDHPQLLEKIRAAHGCATYDDDVAMLDQERLDAVFIFADNAGGEKLFTEAAVRGLPAMVEKPMAHSLAGAEAMLATARRHDVRLMINWPFAWWPQMQHALTVVQRGDVGRLWQVKYRAAHAGPKELGCSEYFCDWLFDASRNGGGAMIDYCCYGALLARVFLGVPSRVTGVSGRLVKEDILVEDNGILVMSYPGAMAISEGSWSQIGNLSSYITMIHGTRGTLMMEPRVGGRLLLADDAHPDGAPLDVPDPPASMRSATAHFVHCLKTGEPFMPLCDDRHGRDAQEILEAGLHAAESGMEVSLPLPQSRRHS
ncbi:MAG: Gfo/Idh/MocA family oxidoreductase [Pirellulaceae bacterium]